MVTGRSASAARPSDRWKLMGVLKEKGRVGFTSEAPGGVSEEAQRFLAELL
jgi:hypothetical protein